MIQDGYGPLADVLAIGFDCIEAEYKKNTDNGPNPANLLWAKEKAGEHIAELITLRGFKASSVYGEDSVQEIVSCVCRSYRPYQDKADFIGVMFQELNVHTELKLGR